MTKQVNKKSFLKSLMLDMCGIAGAGSLTYGAYLQNPALGFATGGALAMAIALLGQKKE